MKRPPPSTHPSPSNSCSSSSSLIDDDRPDTDRAVKPTKKPRKSAQCRAKGKPISDPNRTKFNGRSSAYRGVTRHRWTGRFEAHLWDKSSYNCTQNKKGKQVYLGAYDFEEDAARTYDLAALKYWGLDTILNFPSENYTKEIEEMQNVSKQDYLTSIRRSSSGFSRGVSKYRGVARHHHNGRWEARIGRVFGNKYLYLGTFSSQEEAAKAYDLAAIQYRGRNAVTNFDISNYIPKEEPEPEEKPSFVETKPDQVQNQEQQQQQEHQPPDSAAALAQRSEETELANTSNHSPARLTDGLGCDHERKDEPWSFCLDAAGHDPLLVPLDFHNEERDSILVDRNEEQDSVLADHHALYNEEDSKLFYHRVFHDEQDSSLFDRHVFRNEEEDSSLLDLRAFRNEEEVSNLFDHNVLCNEDEDSILFDHYMLRNEEEDSNLFSDHLFRNEEDPNLFGQHVFGNEEEDSSVFDVRVFCSEKEEPNLLDLHDSNLFDVLDENAFEDDIHLIYNDGVNKGGCKIGEEKRDKSCFDSSSSSPSSSSTVTCDMF